MSETPLDPKQTEEVRRHAQPDSGAGARGAGALPALQLHDLRPQPHSDRELAARPGERIAGARHAGGRAHHQSRRPSVAAIGSLLETHKHNVDEILGEALAHEEEGLAEYRKLLEQVAGKSIMLEEYAREQIAAEEEHLAEIRKMMRKPGSIKVIRGAQPALLVAVCWRLPLAAHAALSSLTDDDGRTAHAAARRRRASSASRRARPRCCLRPAPASYVIATVEYSDEPASREARAAHRRWHRHRHGARRGAAARCGRGVAGRRQSGADREARSRSASRSITSRSNTLARSARFVAPPRRSCRARRRQPSAPRATSNRGSRRLHSAIAAARRRRPCCCRSGIARSTPWAAGI